MCHVVLLATLLQLDGYSIACFLDGCTVLSRNVWSYSVLGNGSSRSCSIIMGQWRKWGKYLLLATLYKSLRVSEGNTTAETQGRQLGHTSSSLFVQNWQVKTFLEYSFLFYHWEGMVVRKILVWIPDYVSALLFCGEIVL